MSAFTPYKNVITSLTGYRLPTLNSNQVPDLQSMLQMYTAAVLGVNIKSTQTKGAESTDKGSAFLIKNILKKEAEDEKEKVTKATNEEAARVELLASNLGKLASGHKCIYCGKMYSRKYGLKIHIRTHTGYKPLKCKHCLRPFGDPSNLNKHIRLHAEGSNPYRCTECGKVMVRKRDLDRHIAVRHKSDTP